MLADLPPKSPWMKAVSWRVLLLLLLRRLQCRRGGGGGRKRACQRCAAAAARKISRTCEARRAQSSDVRLTERVLSLRAATG